MSVSSWHLQCVLSADRSSIASIPSPVTGDTSNSAFVSNPTESLCGIDVATRYYGIRDNGFYYHLNFYFDCTQLKRHQPYIHTDGRKVWDNWGFCRTSALLSAFVDPAVHRFH